MRNGWFSFWCIICTILIIGALISMPILYSFGLVSYVPIGLIVFYLSTIVMMLLMLDTSNSYYNKQIKENKKMNYENEINEIKENINKLNEKMDIIDALVYGLKNSQSYEKVELPFKVGDRVQFKTWEEMEKEFGTNGNEIKVLPVFIHEMKHLCGTYATIKEINGKSVKLCDFTANGDTDWCYSLDMLKHAENKPKWVFTEDEKAILRNVDSKYKYLVRDKSNELWIHGEKPKKVYTCNCWATRWNGVTYLSNIFEFSNIFKCIQWTDGEPCEFRKYI